MRTKPDPSTKKPQRNIIIRHKQASVASGLQVTVKLTEVNEVRSFLGAVEMAKDKVEDGDISKGTAYERIIRAYGQLLERITFGQNDESESL